MLKYYYFGYIVLNRRLNFHLFLFADNVASRKFQMANAAFLTATLDSAGLSHEGT